MLNIASICCLTSFLIASCTRANEVIVCCHSIIHGHRVRLLTLIIEVSLTKQDSYFASFLAAMHGFQLYFHELQQ